MQFTLADESVITVEHTGPEYSPEDRGYRQAYSYSIVTPQWRYDGNDIRSGVAAAPDEKDALGTLLSFLGAAAEAYRYAMGGNTPSENIDLFPPHVTEWAYLNSDEISLLDSDLSEEPST